MTTAKSIPAVVPTTQPERPLQLLSWLLRRREVLLIAAMVVIVAISVVVHPYFWASGNFGSILADSMVITLLALGETFVMLGRGIDLSVGAIMGLAAITVGFQVQNHGMSLVPAVFLGAAVGIVLGLGNAVLVAVASLPPIIATLGTLGVYSGLEFVITNGNQVDTIPNSFTNLASRQFLPGIPEIFVYTLPFVLIAALVLRHTVFGRSVYAVGDDAEAAFRAGIGVRRVLFTTYLLAGLLAGLAGVVFLIYTSGASSTTGANDNLSAIAAALIGGTALTGGRGGAFGALVGSVFLTVTLTAISFFPEVSDVWQPAGVGVLVLLAVLSDRRARQGTLSRHPKRGRWAR
jgi:ribose/xylose/arabinose/galactoside ABC-type transport system permease subunit